MLSSQGSKLCALEHMPLIVYALRTPIIFFGDTTPPSQTAASEVKRGGSASLLPAASPISTPLSQGAQLAAAAPLAAALSHSTTAGAASGQQPVGPQPAASAAVAAASLPEDLVVAALNLAALQLHLMQVPSGPLVH